MWCFFTCSAGGSRKGRFQLEIIASLVGLVLIVVFLFMGSSLGKIAKEMTAAKKIQQFALFFQMQTMAENKPDVIWDKDLLREMGQAGVLNAELRDWLLDDYPEGEE